MERITITIEEDLLETIDAVMRRRGYASRSEAIRDLVRAAAARELTAAGETPCVAVLGYVYDHATRDLAQRLIRVGHEHHDLSIAGMHVHLDHASCLEVSVLKGSVAAVRSLADALTAQRGVRHAHLHVVPAQPVSDRHDHGAGAVTHTHIHV
ncbi:MAG TPA: nickel-responsive transcriptional regulator NikR [Acetobacteraceae bacterium]|nr:nickel-responsive transcriptional regulator NikR [Acetobacteraceae bacterium]